MKKLLVNIIFFAVSSPTLAGITHVYSSEFYQFPLSKFGVQFKAEIELSKESVQDKTAQVKIFSETVGPSLCTLSRRTPHDRVIIKADKNENQVNWKIKSLGEVDHTADDSGVKMSGKATKLVLERAGKGEIEVLCHTIGLDKNRNSVLRPLGETRMMGHLSQYLRFVRETSDEVLNDDTPVAQTPKSMNKQAAAAQ